MKDTGLPPSNQDLERLYRERFRGREEYRRKLWSKLCRYFERWIRPDASVLDLGCGYCEFINQVRCGKKFGMDLNPDAALHAAPGVTLLRQDCSQPWTVSDSSLHVVFTSNFLEHLPDKPSLARTLGHAYKALAPDGRFIALGPNIRYAPGEYWDYFDHHLPISHRSLQEALLQQGFTMERSIGRFLPLTASHGIQYPMIALSAYLMLPPAWWVFGKQFLVVARKA